MKSIVEEHRKVVVGKLDYLKEKVDKQTGWLIGILGTVTTLMVASIVANVIIMGFFRDSTPVQAGSQPPVIIFTNQDVGESRIVNPQQESEGE